MKRYIDEKHLESFRNDFEFLFRTIKGSNGQLILQLRDNYFNIYYRGNSLAKITFFKDNDNYEISIHEKFATEKIFPSQGSFYQVRNSNDAYRKFIVERKYLRRFLAKKNIDRLRRNIEKVNYGEEITVEQILITDNMNRDDLFIIDRQVSEPGFRGKLDLLALKHIGGNRYQFLVLEVKLGKNKELKEKVGGQLEEYVKQIQNNFGNWKQSYELCYEQLKQTRIFDKPTHRNIIIEGEVQGLVVVVGYSQMASAYIEELRRKHKEIEVRQLTYYLEI